MGMRWLEQEDINLAGARETAVAVAEADNDEDEDEDGDRME